MKELHCLKFTFIKWCILFTCFERNIMWKQILFQALPNYCYGFKSQCFPKQVFKAYIRAAKYSVLFSKNIVFNWASRSQGEPTHI